MNEHCALSVVERNARLFLKKRKDYVESHTLNITMHQNGIESFKQSNIMCGFSYLFLSILGWMTKLSANGLILVDKNNNVVGRLECFYGLRLDVGNRHPANQPYVQRWIVSKKSFQKALEDIECPYRVKTAIGSVITGPEA